jgi:gliding motility-associated lipoprotein GldH
MYIWKNGQEIVFNPTIEDISQPYTLAIGIRHVYGIPLNELGIMVTSVSPSGKKHTERFILQLKDSANEHIGSCAGDLCDLEKIINENLKFDEPGPYKFILKHEITGRNIPGIIEVGLIIDKKE